MARCHENRRRRERNRRREEARIWERTYETIEEPAGWCCWCGAYNETEFHCAHCGAEPPWGCPCDFHDGPDDDDAWDYYEDEMEGMDLEDQLEQIMPTLPSMTAPRPPAGPPD
jgi:hypothetical protein